MNLKNTVFYTALFLILLITIVGLWKIQNKNSFVQWNTYKDNKHYIEFKYPNDFNYQDKYKDTDQVLFVNKNNESFVIGSKNSGIGFENSNCEVEPIIKIINNNTVKLFHTCDSILYIIESNKSKDFYKIMADKNSIPKQIDQIVSSFKFNK